MQPDVSNLPIRDIHLPDPVSWWPPALGWWLLLVLVVVSAALVWWQIRHHRLHKLRKVAMAELDAVYRSYQTHNDASHFARELSALLRRICISYFPHRDTAGLTGTAWLVFLDSVLSPKHNKSGQKFSNGVGTVLLKAPYQNKLQSSDIDAQALYQLSVEWIESLGPFHGLKPARSSLSNEAAHVSV